MRVNVLAQCLATIFIPTGLYAFKRINKFKMGVLVYVVSGVIAFFGGMLSVFTSEYVSIGCLIVSFIIPMIFVIKWSNEFNSKVTIIK